MYYTCSRTKNDIGSDYISVPRGWKITLYSTLDRHRPTCMSAC